MSDFVIKSQLKKTMSAQIEKPVIDGVPIQRRGATRIRYSDPIERFLAELI